MCRADVDLISFFCSWISRFASTIYWVSCLFLPVHVFDTFIKNWMSLAVLSVSLRLRFHWSTWMLLCLVPCCLVTMSLWYSWRWCKVMMPHLCSQIGCFGSLWSFVFPYTFQGCFVWLCEECHGNLDEHCIESVDYFGHTPVFTVFLYQSRSMEGLSTIRCLLQFLVSAS